MPKIISTEGSSQKYGNCERCGDHCTEVFHLFGWNGEKYIDAFGHESCMEKEKLENE